MVFLILPSIMFAGLFDTGVGTKTPPDGFCVRGIFVVRVDSEI